MVASALFYLMNYWQVISVRVSSFKPNIFVEVSCLSAIFVWSCDLYSYQTTSDSEVLRTLRTASAHLFSDTWLEFCLSRVKGELRTGESSTTQNFNSQWMTRKRLIRSYQISPNQVKGFIQASLSKIQGLLKDFPTIFKVWKLKKNTDLHVEILLLKC